MSAEANLASEDGDWGAELGAGYSLLNAGGFSLTPGAGVYIHDNDGSGDTSTQLYGRVEASYSIPASVTLGIGARFAHEVRPYGTISYPLLPMLSVKGNIGDDYYSAGLQAKF
ncbi:hypothetical protein GRI39_02500 [Altererythrobacter indicus]|uniref:Uncharacterized protein n=1 Tax=Altericroceibacterium indicum TaxID=374177 RepID=A0A845A8M4_9SPHN|nr:hypothetical protein [Altericroceibacterium indicum]